MKTDRIQIIRNIRCGLSDIKPNKFEPLEKGEDDPCWEDYVQVGTKIVDGREVPNCVPMEASKYRNLIKRVSREAQRNSRVTRECPSRPQVSP